LAASVVIGIACFATISTDAFAYRGGRVGVLATQNNFLARFDKPLARPHGMRAAQCAR
jgi:hypothetical protein